jgi:hypothetical protein
LIVGGDQSVSVPVSVVKEFIATAIAQRDPAGQPVAEATL